MREATKNGRILKVSVNPYPTPKKKKDAQNGSANAKPQIDTMLRNAKVENMPAPKGNHYAKGNKGGGRPGQYLDHYAKLAYKYCLKGAIDSDLAVLFGVSEQTINNWKLKHEDFSLALRRGKAVVDCEVAKKLFENAISGDLRAIIFWLKNRRSEYWADRRNHEHSAPGIEVKIRTA